MSAVRIADARGRSGRDPRLLARVRSSLTGTHSLSAVSCVSSNRVSTGTLVIQTANCIRHYSSRGTRWYGEVVREQLCTAGRATRRRGTRDRQVVDARGGGSSHFSHLCSFPDPTPARAKASFAFAPSCRGAPRSQKVGHMHLHSSTTTHHRLVVPYAEHDVRTT